MRFEISLSAAIMQGPQELLNCLDHFPDGETLSATHLLAAQTVLGPLSDQETALRNSVAAYKTLIGLDPSRASQSLRSIGKSLAAIDPKIYQKLIEQMLQRPPGKVISWKIREPKLEGQLPEHHSAKLLDYKAAFLERNRGFSLKKQIESLYRLSQIGVNWALAVLLQLAAFYQQAAEASYELALEVPDFFEAPHLTAATALAHGNFWIQKLVDTMLEKRPHAMLSGLIQGSKISGNVWAAEKLYQESVQHLERFQLRHVLALTDLATKNYWAAEALKSIANSEWMTGLSEKDRSKLLLRMKMGASKNAEIDAALGIWFERVKNRKRRA